MYRRFRFAPALALVAMMVMSAMTGLTAGGAPSARMSAVAPVSNAATTGGHGPAFAYYYLWWDTAHWHATLGPSYPYGASPLPLPATLAANGCHPKSTYPRNIETDVPTHLFTQTDQAQMNRDVSSAIAAGLTGFAVNWKGAGTTSQTPTSYYLNQRLAMLVRAVEGAQAAGHSFHLWLSYEASASTLSEKAIANDLAYFHAHYASASAFDHSNGGKPTFIWVGSYKYGTKTVAAISTRFRPDFYLVGGYQYNQWSSTDATYFQADSPYWSAQDPYNDRSSFSQLAGLASKLHSEGKKYFAPLTPGFDRQLDHSAGCVPRDSGQTLRQIYSGNLTGHPDGWLVISWNEFTEGTYVTPQLQRYGSLYGGSGGILHQLLH